MTTDQMPDPVELALRGYEPTVRPPALAGGDVAYVVDDLAVGRMLLAARVDGVLLLSAYAPDDASTETLLDRVAHRVSPRVLRDGRSLDPIRRQFEEYLSGRRRSFDVRLDERLATPFQRVVLDRLSADVGYGSTTTYGRLAAGSGKPRAARAVGAALGANPLCIVLPCHRVLGASGDLTGYAGGMAAKRLLLDLEQRAC